MFLHYFVAAINGSFRSGTHIPADFWCVYAGHCGVITYIGALSIPQYRSETAVLFRYLFWLFSQLLLNC